MDFSAKKLAHANIINMLSKGGQKEFMYVDIKQNVYELQEGQRFFKSYTGQSIELTDNVELGAN